MLGLINLMNDILSNEKATRNSHDETALPKRQTFETGKITGTFVFLSHRLKLNYDG